MYHAQKHSFGCGIAAVANATGVSYDASAQYFNLRFADTRGYFCRNLVDALRKLGYNYRYCKYKPNKQELLNRPGTIVFVARSEQLPEGHWLARTDEGWVDSWINFHQGAEVSGAKAGIRHSLPGVPEWLVYIAGNVHR